MTSNNIKQTANTVLMVRPVDFVFNAETAVDNEFQHAKDGVTETALAEFAKSVEVLENEGIRVLVLEGQEGDAADRVKTPDAVFPNNWFGTTNDGKVIVYTMANANRKAEANRLNDVLSLLEKHGYMHDPLPLILETETPDVLEGTGALVIDHIGGVVYAAKSVRCSAEALDKFMQLRSNLFNKSLLFQTKSSTGKEFYHTNVMLSIGTQFAVVCSESIVEQPDHPTCVSRQAVMEELAKTRVVIDITLEQAEKYFCANILELRGANNEAKIVMSESAYKGFTQDQRDQLTKCGKIVQLPITDAIEYVGGGSARCMLAEVFLQQ